MFSSVNIFVPTGQAVSAAPTTSGLSSLAMPSSFSSTMPSALGSLGASNSLASSLGGSLGLSSNTPANFLNAGGAIQGIQATDTSKFTPKDLAVMNQLQQSNPGLAKMAFGPTDINLWFLNPALTGMDPSRMNTLASQGDSIFNTMLATGSLPQNAMFLYQQSQQMIQQQAMENAYLKGVNDTMARMLGIGGATSGTGSQGAGTQGIGSANPNDLLSQITSLLGGSGGQNALAGLLGGQSSGSTDPVQELLKGLTGNLGAMSSKNTSGLPAQAPTTGQGNTVDSLVSQLAGILGGGKNTTTKNATSALPALANQNDAVTQLLKSLGINGTSFSTSSSNTSTNADSTDMAEIQGLFQSLAKDIKTLTQDIRSGS